MTAVEWFVQDLRQRGVEWIATLCGHGLDPLDHACRKQGLRLVDVRNEQTAAYMAEVHGRLTGRAGVVAVSSGVAHANAMTGVVDAFFDGAPMLLITGAGALATSGMGHFQDLDQAGLAAPVTKYSRTIDSPERTLQILDEALHIAQAPRPGPVHITFPADMQQREVEESAMVPRARRPGDANPPRYAGAGEIAARIAAARRPLIIAGSGVYYNGEGEALAAFSEAFSIPVVTPIWDRGSIERPMESFLGVIGAATGGPRLLPDADLVILAGAQADYRVGYLQPKAVAGDAEIARLDRGWTEMLWVYKKADGKRHTDWLAEVRRRRSEFREGVEAKARKQAGTALHSMHVIRAIGKALTDDMVLLLDGGSIGQWAHQLLTDRYPGHWLTCGRSGVVGWGLGGAMAARLTYPGRPVVLLSGDGAFTFTVAEIECAARQGLSFVAIVADDEAWGITQAGHIRQFGEAITSSLGPIDFVRLAQSLGARGVRATSEEEIHAELMRGLDSKGVTVIHVPIVGGSP